MNSLLRPRRPLPAGIVNSTRPPRAVTTYLNFSMLLVPNVPIRIDPDQPEKRLDKSRSGHNCIFVRFSL